MKIFYGILLFGLIFATDCFAQMNGKKSSLKNNSVVFQQFEGYFEKNNSELKGDKSYLVFTDQEQFEKVFGEARTMKSEKFLPADIFKTQLVVAVIKRGGLRKYKNVKVTAKNKKIFVSYDAEDAKQDSAIYSSPLIVAFDKGTYDKIYLMENGKNTGSVIVAK